MVDVVEVSHRNQGIVELRVAEILARFGKRRNEMGMLSASERDHRKPVWEGREVLLQFVRGPARRDEGEFVEIEAPVGGRGDGTMAGERGNDRHTEKRNAAGGVL